VEAWATAVKLFAISSVIIVTFPITVFAASVATCSTILVTVVVVVVVDVSIGASGGASVLSAFTFSASSSLLYSSSEDTVSFRGLNSSVRLWLARE